jgi:hypothetical protein
MRASVTIAGEYFVASPDRPRRPTAAGPRG